MKPILVGESNPYGGDPYFALYPSPDGCAGHRLCCKILGMRRSAYMKVFDRINLCASGWNMREARRAANRICVSRTSMVLLGSKVCAAFRLRFDPFTVIKLPRAVDADFDRRVVILPHPSGRCRAWNKPGAFRQARDVMTAAMPGLTHLVGVDL